MPLDELSISEIVEPGKPLTKGQRTAARLLDAAEALFARQGYHATSLRAIAQVAGIREPGIYNHFSNKQALYASTVERALAPLVLAMRHHMASGVDAFVTLPAVVIDVLAAHKYMPSLLQQVLQGSADVPEVPQLRQSLKKVFVQGGDALRRVGGRELNSEEVAMRVIAIFNLCTGYFLSQRSFELLAESEIDNRANVARQKQLVSQLHRSFFHD